MCERYYLQSQKEEIADRFGIDSVFEGLLAPNYNITPGTAQPIIRQMRGTEIRELILMKWGLIPNFAKTLADWKVP